MIDEIDKQIMMLLQDDARLSNAAIAEQVGLTASSVYERVKKLEKRGIIEKYVAVVNPEALGIGITAFIRLRVWSGMAQDYREAKAAVTAVCQAETAVLECHGVAGEDCYILKVRVDNPKGLEALLERLRSQTLVTDTVSSIVLSTYKETMKIEV